MNEPRGTTGSFRVTSLNELDRIEVAGVGYRPIRRALGISSFGINAFSADDGAEVIEQHDETGGGSGKQEELYLVVSGAARFTVDDRTIEAPAGTMVFVPDLASRRGAVAVADGTTVVVVGGPADRALPTSPFEYWYAAEPAYRAGDHRRAYEIASAGLDEWPAHGVLNYQLACYSALAGDREQALDHLTLAVRGEARAAGWAQDDEDLDSIRDDPRFPGD